MTAAYRPIHSSLTGNAATSLMYARDTGSTQYVENVIMKRWIGLALVAGLVFAACGGSVDSADGVASLEEVTDAEPTTETTVAEEVDQEQAVLDLVQCLRDEGLDVADPEVDADGNVNLRGLFRQAEEAQLDPDAVDAAMEACSDLLEGVQLGLAQDFDFTEIQDQLLEFAACMRDNGYDMPDPDLTTFGQGPGGGGGPFRDLDQDDPDFQAALEACQDTLPGFGQGGGPAGGRP